MDFAIYADRLAVVGCPLMSLDLTITTDTESELLLPNILAVAGYMHPFSFFNRLEFHATAEMCILFGSEGIAL